MVTNSICWLHLSDFHTGKDAFGQERLFSYICHFVAEKVRSGESPDLVFITGDVANTGKEAEYSEFTDKFLSPLSQALGENLQSKLYVVPGNHDCDWKQAFIVDWHAILDRFPDYLNPMDAALTERQDVLRRFNGFANCDCSHMKGKWVLSSKGVFTETIDRFSAKLGILGINTAWLSQGDDEEKLTPGKGMVELGLAALSGCEILIVLGHHSLDWFRKDDRRQIQSLFGKNHVIYLHGDLHENDMGLRLGGGYPFLDFQATAAFQARESTTYANGFQWCILDIEKKELSVQPLVWSNRNQEWGVDGIAFPERFRKSGTDRWVFPLPESSEARKLYLQIKPPSALEPPAGWYWVDRAFVKRRTIELSKEQTLEYFDGSVPNWEESLSAIMPRRDVVHRVVKKLTQNQGKPEGQVVVLYGPSGEGKSTCLHQTIAELITTEKEWKVLWRTDWETAVPIDFLLGLPRFEGTWLVASDEAYEIAKSVCDAVNALHLAGRTDIRFLLCSRDTDWISAKANDFPWPDKGYPTLEPIKGLTLNDAEQIVAAWKKFEDEGGMGSLTGMSVKDASAILADAAQEEQLKNPLEGSFLGAMLRVRKSEDFEGYVDSLLFRLSRREITPESKLLSGTKLLNAFAYIAVVHADGLINLPKALLAQLLHFDLRQLNKLVIGPLGDEAAATLAGNSVITRHRSIAKTAIPILRNKYHIHQDEIYPDLVKAAWDAPFTDVDVINRTEWLHLSRKLYDVGREALGLQLAGDLYKRDRTDTYLVVTYASLLRDSGNAGQSVDILRNSYKGLKKDRAFYFEWGMAEGKLDRFCVCVCLAGISLADETEGVLDTKNVMMRLVALSNALEELYQRFRLPVFIEATGAAAQLGIRMQGLTDRELAVLSRGWEMARQAGVGEMDVSTALRQLHAGMLASWLHKESELPVWVKDPESLTFKKLEDLLVETREVETRGETAQD